MNPVITENVKVEFDSKIAVVTIENPPANSLTDKTLNNLKFVFDELKKVDDVRAVIITGCGKFFIAGADIKEFSQWTFDTGYKYTIKGRNIITQIENYEVPVIAAVNGVALGGGLEMALACDIRISSENAKFGLPEVGLGIIPGYGGTQRLIKHIGPGKTKELLFTGRTVKADEAYKLGLVQYVVPTEDVLGKAMEIAQEISKKAPIAVSQAKRAVNYGMNSMLGDCLEFESICSRVCFATEDRNEGTDAFINKREPEFKNK